MLRSIGNILAVIVDVVFGIILLLLGFRILFKLLGADPTAQLSRFLYNSTNVFVEPFAGVFAPIELGANNFLELGAIFAFFLVLFFGVILIEIISLLTGSTMRVYKVRRV
jgi:hypothetical protein